MRRVLAAAALAVLIFAALASACFAQDTAPAARKPGIVKKVLENGLTVVVKPEKGSGLVAIVAIVRAGAAQEGIQNAGIGNFVAQLLLAGTRLSSAEEVAAVADEVGGNIGAQWHPDFTEIRAVTTSAMFNRAMTLIGESLTEANFEKQWVEQVRTDLQRRMATDTEDVFEEAYGRLRELLYEDNGYRRPNIGFERTVRLASPQDLKKFLNGYYVPNNVIISVAGDVTVEQVVDRAGKAFAGIAPGKLPVDRGVPDETLDRSKFHASEAELAAAYLLLGWLAPGTSSPDYAAMAVAANALGGGKGSAMFRELRQKRGMGYDVGTMYPRYRYQSHLLAYIITDPFKARLPGRNPTVVLDEVRAALLEQVEKLRNEPLSDTDLQRAKGYTIGSYALSQQHLMSRAFQLGWLEAIGAGYDMYWRYPDEVDKVTAADVQRVAGKYLTNYAAVVLVPKTRSPAAEGAKETE